MENVSHNTSWSVNSELETAQDNNGYAQGAQLEAEDENVELSQSLIEDELPGTAHRVEDAMQQLSDDNMENTGSRAQIIREVRLKPLDHKRWTTEVAEAKLPGIRTAKIGQQPARLAKTVGEAELHDGNPSPSNGVHVHTARVPSSHSISNAMQTASMHAGNSTQFLSAFGGTGSYHYQPVSHMSQPSQDQHHRAGCRANAIEEEAKVRPSEPEDNMVASSSDEEKDVQAFALTDQNSLQKLVQSKSRGGINMSNLSQRSGRNTENGSIYQSYAKIGVGNQNPDYPHPHQGHQSAHGSQYEHSHGSHRLASIGAIGALHGGQRINSIGTPQPDQSYNMENSTIGQIQMAEMAEEMLVMEQQPPHQGKFLIVSSSTRLPDLPQRPYDSLPAQKLAEAVCQYQRRRADIQKAFDRMRCLPAKAELVIEPTVVIQANKGQQIQVLSTNKFVQIQPQTIDIGTWTGQTHNDKADIAEEAARQLFPFSETKRPKKQSVHVDFEHVIIGLKNLEFNFSGEHCRRLTNNLETQLSNLNYELEQFENLKRQTHLKNQNLAEIEQALFERELQLDNRIQASEQRAIELAIEGENIQAFKASQAVGRLSAKTQSVQTDMIYFKHVIEREVIAQKREDQLEIRSFKFKQEFEELEKAARRIKREVEIQERLLNQRATEVKNMEKIVSDRYQKQLAYPYSCLGDLSKEIKAFLSNLEPEEVTLESDREFQAYMKMPHNAEFLEKIAGFMDQLRVTGSMSHEQAELLFFKKAKGMLRLHFKNQKLLEHNKMVTEHLIQEKRKLDMDTQLDQERRVNLELLTDQELYIKAEHHELEDKQNQFRALMEVVQSNFDGMMQDLVVEGYTLKQPNAGSAMKELWNNSMNLNSNISQLLNNQAQKMEQRTGGKGVYAGQPNTEHLTPSRQLNDRVSRLSNMSNDGYTMAEGPEHQLNRSSFVLNQFLNKDLRSDNSPATGQKEALATPEVERRTERAGQVRGGHYRAAMVGPAAQAARGRTSSRQWYQQWHQQVKDLQDQERNIEGSKELWVQQAQKLENQLQSASKVTQRANNQQLENTQKINQEKYLVDSEEFGRKQQLTWTQQANIELIDNREQQVWNESTLRLQSNRTESRRSERSRESFALQQDGGKAIDDRNQYSRRAGDDRNNYTEEFRKEDHQPHPLQEQSRWPMHRTNASPMLAKPLAADKTRSRSQRHPREAYNEQLVDLHEQERQLYILHHDLQIQKDFTNELNGNLLQQLAALEAQKEDLKMMETEMNQQKLRMLLKFDKIKFLEDFYNQHRVSINEQKDAIRLDVEVDQQQLLSFCTAVYVNHSRRVQEEEKRRYWALYGITQLLKALTIKRNQTRENKKRFNLYLWKVQAMRKESQLDISAREKVLQREQQVQASLVQEDEDEIDVEPKLLLLGRDQELKEASEPERWETTSMHWEKLRNSGQYELKSLQQLTGRQLFDLGNTLHGHIRSFHRFREKNILELMFLHFRRRARLLLYFAFQKYKIQIYKSVISESLQKEELAISPGTEGANMYIVEQHKKGGALKALLSARNQIIHRQRGALLVQALIKAKSNSFAERRHAFSAWRDLTVSSEVVEAQNQNQSQSKELAKLKVAHSQMLQLFEKQKADLESKLQRMAILIAQKFANQSQSQ